MGFMAQVSGDCLHALELKGIHAKGVVARAGFNNSIM